MREALAQRKHLILLCVTLIAELLQPLARGLVLGLLFYDVLVVTVMLVVLLVVFESGRSRQIGLALAIPGVLADWLHYFVPEQYVVPTEIVHHCMAFAFFTYAVVVILRGVFSHRVVGIDEVIGALCGYLLGGAAFANLFVLVELFAPDSFQMNPAMASQLLDWHSRRFVFGYFSFVSLTSMGYGDITPVRPAAASLTWMEAVFGQFYLAVVVAQLVALWLPRVARPGHRQPTEHR